MSTRTRGSVIGEKCVHGIKLGNACVNCGVVITKFTTALTDIDSTLAQRESTYGNFLNHAQVTQDIKLAMQNSKNWETLDVDKKEALEMIAHKIGRILNGDPNYHDSWHDIIGYTKLIADTLRES